MKGKWGLFMTEQKKNTIITSGIAVLAVILSYCFRIVGRGSFYPMLFSYLRSFIYIGLFAAWGLSVRQRIVQKQVCRFMTVTAVLLIIWMVVRSAKYFIFWQPDAVRYLWYLFYLPMLFVPMLALLIAMSLGKPDEYKFPKGMSILWIISGTLLLLVLTNDLHQFVFTFPKDAAVWTDKNNGYSIGYFIIVGWQVLCAFAALVIMFLKCRVQKGRLHFLPIVPMLLTIVYSVLYYAGADWLLHLFGDIAAFQSVMYILTFEFCIACGYIHSNSRYVDLFASSVGTSAEITDKDFTVRYAAVNTAPISKETIKKAEQSPVTMGGLTVHTMPIDGGYAVWTEDVSALRDIKEDSKLLADELADRNKILRYEYKREAKRRKVEEQNRLYDLLRSATQTQIDRIAELTKEYRRISSTDHDSAKTLLAEIAVLCSYIKRRKHLTLLTDRDIKIAGTELHHAFNESLQTLKLLGVRSSLYVDSDDRWQQITAHNVTELYNSYQKQEEINEELAEVNRKLRKMYARMEDDVKEKESLDLKVYIHDTIGRSLLTIRDIIDSGEDTERKLEALQNAIGMLANNRVTSVSTMDEVKRTAQQLGVAVKIDGYLPRDTAAEELTVAAAKECVTNCIKHADGNEVYIRIAQRGERYDVTITNNGKIPTEPIKEGSGLSTLRRSIESSGGEMHISHNPRFALLITIPAKEISL